MQVGADGVDVVDGLTDNLMVLATQTSPTDNDDDNDNGLSSGIIAVIVVLVVLTILVLVIVFAGYLVYRRKQKSHYDISNLSKQHSVAEYVSDNAIVNPSYITIPQTQSSKIQEMVSTEPEPLKENPSTEEDAYMIRNANVDGEEDKDTHL